MSGPRTLHLDSEDAALAELAKLRKGYIQHGKWTLAQMSWHLAKPMHYLDAPPPNADLKRTPEQEAKKTGFVDHIIKTGTAPPSIKEAPPTMIPPTDAGDADIQRFETLLLQMKNHPHARIIMGPIGPVDFDDYRKCILFHAEHHLAFLTPRAKARRANLTFANEDAVIEDVKRLRKGYEQFGAWSLRQVCCHLDFAVKSRMAPPPFPLDTDEQAARRPIAEKILANEQLPDGLVAPDPMQPPADCGDDAIDSFIAKMQKFKSFTGPIAPHRIFGTLSDADARKLNLIHCARHLSFLTPTT